MNKIFVNTREQLDDLLKGDALTWEGLKMDTEEDYGEVKMWLYGYGTTCNSDNVYIILGSDMNRIEGLTGKNAYPDDCNIVCFKLSELDNWQSIIIARFEVGGRWLSDVIDNNRRREGVA